MAKAQVSKTYNPIHFEDLDPHRFEDLIRELIYDFKDWQSIEATGRSGGDDGFDIRAYEKVEVISQTENSKNEVVEEIHPMEGNLWMIQGKREKEIGPKKLKEYMDDVDEKNPPYGYVLAASANFSKKAYDVFREELRKKGVMEFYLWSKSELEDMLHLPKNDRILFTFFGYSLVSKRRSRTTEIRSAVNMKNKIYRALGDGQDFHKSVLIRDIKDTHYPYKDQYKDFEKKPRWKEYIACDYHPLGLWCHSHKYLAYVDNEKKQWDFTKEVDLVFRQKESNEEQKERIEKQELVNSVWEFFPRSKQGYFIIDCIVEYNDILLVDDKGDVLYKFPHLYVDFVGDNGPFAGAINNLKIGNEEISLTKDYTRISVFPKKIKKRKLGKIYKNKKIVLDADSLRQFEEYKLDTLYETDGRYNFLKPGDVIPVSNVESEYGKEFIQITYAFKSKISDYLNKNKDNFSIKLNIRQQLGREFNDEEDISIYEIKKIYEWKLKEKEV